MWNELVREERTTELEAGAADKLGHSMVPAGIYAEPSRLLVSFARRLGFVRLVACCPVPFMTTKRRNAKQVHG